MPSKRSFVPTCGIPGTTFNYLPPPPLVLVLSDPALQSLGAPPAVPTLPRSPLPPPGSLPPGAGHLKVQPRSTVTAAARGRDAGSPATTAGAVTRASPIWTSHAAPLTLRFCRRLVNAASLAQVHRSSRHIWIRSPPLMPRAPDGTAHCRCCTHCRWCCTPLPLVPRTAAAGVCVCCHRSQCCRLLT